MNNAHNDEKHGEAKEPPKTAWTKEQGEEIGQLYEQVMARPDYNRIKDQVNAEVFPSTGELPFEEAKQNLLNYIPNNLEGKVHSHKPAPRKATQFESGIGLGGIATTLAGIISANPIVAVAGAAMAAYALIPKYSAQKLAETH